MNEEKKRRGEYNGMEGETDNTDGDSQRIPPSRDSIDRLKEKEREKDS